AAGDSTGGEPMTRNVSGKREHAARTPASPAKNRPDSKETARVARPVGPRSSLPGRAPRHLHIEPVQVADTNNVLRLLERHQLPLDGLQDHLATTLVAREDDRIVGSAALEVYPDGALLRSVAVAPERQGHGLGHLLTEA